MLDSIESHLFKTQCATSYGSQHTFFFNKWKNAVSCYHDFAVTVDRKEIVQN